MKAEEISIEGRICSVADVFDALISERPCKKAWSVEQAIQLIEQKRQELGLTYTARNHSWQSLLVKTNLL